MSAISEYLLSRTSPESQGIASKAMLQFVEAVESQIHELHSFMLLRHGKVVAEGWWSPYRKEAPHMLFSLSKSFTSTAVGLAIAEGCFSIDDPVLSFFPDEAPAEVSTHLAELRVRHLLSMSTGHAEDTTPHMVMRPDGNWTKGFFEVPILHQPGTHFLYNTGATYMLSAILQKTTGMKLVDYLATRLFQPLGIENPIWEESPQGVSVGGWGLNIKTEDIARFGQLYLQKGLWQGQQIVPEAWVEEATSYQVANREDPNSDWAQGYGYQFWRCQHAAYRGDGAFGQYCVIMPEQDAVLAITSGLGDMQLPLNLVWEILLPAMSADALPEDADNQALLAKKLSGLNIPPVQGSLESPLASNVSEQVYHVAANDLNIQTISLKFGESHCTLNIKTEALEESLACGYGVWQEDKTLLFNEWWNPHPKAMVASGAWTTEDVFTMVIRLRETPFFYTLVCRFTEQQLTLDCRVNVSFEPIETLTLVAHLD